jgi:hypothetical protein
VIGSSIHRPMTGLVLDGPMSRWSDGQISCFLPDDGPRLFPDPASNGLSQYPGSWQGKASESAQP